MSVGAHTTTKNKRVVRALIKRRHPYIPKPPYTSKHPYPLLIPDKTRVCFRGVPMILYFTPYNSTERAGETQIRVIQYQQTYLLQMLGPSKHRSMGVDVFRCRYGVDRGISGISTHVKKSLIK